MLNGNEARKRWAEYFKELLNVQEDREADIVAAGGCRYSGSRGGVQVPIMREENEREMTREGVKREMKEPKGGKAPGMDGVRVEMLNEGGVTALEWLVRVLNPFSASPLLYFCALERHTFFRAENRQAEVFLESLL